MHILSPVPWSPCAAPHLACSLLLSSGLSPRPSGCGLQVVCEQRLDSTPPTPSLGTWHFPQHRYVLCTPLQLPSVLWAGA